MSPAYTLSALIVFPIAIASHSPGAVVCPVFMAMPGIVGDHAKLVISLAPVYAITGSVSTCLRVLSGRGEFKRAFATVDPCAFAACDMSQSSN